MNKLLKLLRTHLNKAITLNLIHIRDLFKTRKIVYTYLRHLKEAVVKQ